MLDEMLWPSVGTDPLIVTEGPEGFSCIVMAGVEISIFTATVCFLTSSLTLGHVERENAQSNLLCAHWIFSRL